MKPYTLLSHIIDEHIASALNTDRYAYMYFPDHIRFDHGLLTKQPGLSKDGIVRETDGDPWTWLETKYHGSNYSYHCGTWLPGAIPHGGGAEFKRRAMNFIEHHWEPVDYNLDKIFWDDVKKEGKHIVLHSEHNSKDIEILREQGILGIHWFSHAYLCSEVYFKHYYKLNLVKNYTARPIRSPWLCANRLLRQHRTDFLEMLDLSQGCYSLLNPDPNGLTYTGPVPAHSFDCHKNHSAEINVEELTPWTTSFLHVVNETVWQDKIHFTEKVFKPVVLHQPFVVLQAPGSLLYLRSYGFKTFGAWWDESYDTIKDPQERMQAIADIVNWIGTKSTDELETMRMEMASVLEHNFRHFYEKLPAICLNELSVGLSFTP